MEGELASSKLILPHRKAVCDNQRAGQAENQALSEWSIATLRWRASPCPLAAHKQARLLNGTLMLA